MTKRTQSNYLKSLKRFLTFHTSSTNLYSTDAELHEECKEYCRVLTSTLRLLRKQAKKEQVQKRFDYCGCVNGHLLPGPLISACCNLSICNTGAFTKILVSHITFFTLLFSHRHTFLMDENPLTPDDCQLVLVKAKEQFLACMETLSEEGAEELDSADKVFVLYYLEAIVILQHFQRPSVVQNMTVSEWQSRGRGTSNETGETFCVVGVKEHKTSAHQVATFALSEEQEQVSSQQFLHGHVKRQNIFSVTAEHNLTISFSLLNILSFLLQWFDLYYKRLRPDFQRAGRKRKRDEDETDPKDFFFLSSAGTKIHRPSSDLHRLHNKFDVPVVTSQMARRICETATRDMSSSEQTLVSTYLTHRLSTRDQHYRYTTTGNVLHAKTILGCVVVRSSSEESSSDAERYHCDSSRESESSSSPQRKTRSGTAAKSKSESAFDLLQKKFPVTIAGPKPHRSLLEVDDISWQNAYDRWLKGQEKLQQECVRCEYILFI